MLKNRKYTLAFFSWMAFITYASLSSFDSDDFDVPTIDIPHFDKVVHFTFYFVAAVLATFFVREMTKGRFPLNKTLWYTVFGAIAFGIIIEILQYAFTLYRQGEIFDALANSLGAITGSWIMKWLFSHGRRLKWK